MKFFDSPTMHSIWQRFRRLYGDDAKQCMERLSMLIGRYGLHADSGMSLELQPWSQHDTVLITYGDMVRCPGESPLQTLQRFLAERGQGVIDTVHLLPFFPYSSDDGFSVINYRLVNPALGSWEDIDRLNLDFKLMFDLVLNHVSRESEWFKDYVCGIRPARHYFHEVDPNTDLSQVVRPRNLPLLSPAHTRDGDTHLWTTFSSDQIDLDFGNPDVLFEFLDILLLYIDHGAHILRLDAIAYLWKQIGSRCIHLPETHEIVKLLREVMRMIDPSVLILTETNVPHTENISYFGDGDEAHIVYQFSLPPLLLHALQTGQSRFLSQWAANLQDDLPPGCTYLNFTASHDGIGVRPLEGIIPAAEFERLISGIKQRGGIVSTKRNTDGSESPYELNITYFDALSDPDNADEQLHIARFLCSQSVALVLCGIPAIYFHSWVGTRNDNAAVKRSGIARAINRHKWNLDALEAVLHDQHSTHARVFAEYSRRLQLRRLQSAFHPDAPQQVLDLGEGVFAIGRVALDKSQTVVALHNFTPAVLDVPLNHPVFAAAGNWVDLLSSQRASAGQLWRLQPYQCSWLELRR